MINQWLGLRHGWCGIPIVSLSLSVLCGHMLDAQQGGSDDGDREMRSSAVLALPPLIGVGVRMDGAEAVLPRTAIYGDVDVNLFESELLSKGIPVDDTVAAHAARANMRNRAQGWFDDLAPLLSDRMSGFLLDHFASIAATVESPSHVVAAVDARLREQNLSVVDRAFTLLAAIRHLADVNDPSRMQHVDRYVQQLQELEGGGRWHCAARITLTRLYAKAGDSIGVFRHAAAALEEARQAHFDDRWRLLLRYPYAEVADVLAGADRGRERIDSLERTLLESIEATPAEIQEDSSRGLGRSMARILKKSFNQYRSIGKTATPIRAHAWYNTPQDPARVVLQDMPLNDGKIRVIEFGNRDCRFCLMALPFMQWLSKRFAHDNVEMIYVTETKGSWGVNIVPAATEVEAMRHFYTNPDSGTFALTFPVAVWAGQKMPTEEGGMLPAPNPNRETYNVHGTPTLVVVDGRGIIRKVLVGWAPGRHRELQDFIRYLLAST